MRTKILLFILSLFFAVSASATAITDDRLDFQGQQDGDVVYPVAEITLLEGVISYTNKTITTTFFENLGNVTLQVVSESGQLYITEETTATEGGTFTIDIATLPAGKYNIICYIPGETNQVAKFQLTE